MKNLWMVAAFIVTFAVVLPCEAAEAPKEPTPDEAAAAGKAGKKKEESTVEVLLDSDTISLKDGSTVSGTVIMVAEKAAVILTEDGEKMIPRQNIEKIEHGKNKDQPTTLPVKKSDGFQFIVMEPIEEAPESAKKASEDEDGKKNKGAGSAAEKLKKLKPDEIKNLLDKDDDLEKLLDKVKERSKKKRDKGDADEEKQPPPTAKW
jgi:hypothetical protein